MIRRISHCLNGQLTTLCHTVLQLDALTHTLLPFLPETLQPHCRVASFHRGKLVIALQDIALATELNYLLPSLRNTLRAEGKLHQLVSVHMNTRVGINEAPASKLRTIAPKVFTPHTRETLETARDVCHYEPLKKAWQHLLDQTT